MLLFCLGDSRLLNETAFLVHVSLVHMVVGSWARLLTHIIMRSLCQTVDPYQLLVIQAEHPFTKLS